MAKATKKTQTLHTIVISALLLVFVILIAGSILENVVIFMLTGYIVGTNYAVPAWAMFALYGGAATLLASSYILHKERENYYLKKIRSTGRRPRRRYSSI